MGPGNKLGLYIRVFCLIKRFAAILFGRVRFCPSCVVCTSVEMSHNMHYRCLLDWNSVISRNWNKSWEKNFCYSYGTLVANQNGTWQLGFYPKCKFEWIYRWNLWELSRHWTQIWLGSMSRLCFYWSEPICHMLSLVNFGTKEFM